MQTNEKHLEETCGIEYDPSDFPQRSDSPDPGRVIEVIADCGGVVSDAAEHLPMSESSLYRWSSAYEPIREAIELNRSAVAIESRDRIIDLMRQDDDRRTALKAAKKLATMFDGRLDWSRRERRELTKKEDAEEEAKREVEDMTQDELLEELSTKFDG